jgi:glycosyltransferase involved in cell wall biosynthesis
MDGHVVSVIIPTLGRATLAETLSALEQQTRPADDVQVVCDTGRRGVAWARNEGFAASRGDLVAFLDDDLVPPPDWIARLVAAIDRHDADGAGGTYDETDPLLREIRARKGAPPQAEAIDADARVGVGGNVMFRRAALERAAIDARQIYNESFGAEAGEDWELVARLRLAGARLVYVPVASTHLRRAGFRTFLRFQFKRGIGIALLRAVFRGLGPASFSQRSLLWGAPGKDHRPRWIAALWRKLLGPFDRKSFGSARRFWTFWLGEKAQSLGFLWAIATGRAARVRVSPPRGARAMEPEGSCRNG